MMSSRRRDVDGDRERLLASDNSVRHPPKLLSSSSKFMNNTIITHHVANSPPRSPFVTDRSDQSTGSLRTSMTSETFEVANGPLCLVLHRANYRHRPPPSPINTSVILQFFLVNVFIFLSLIVSSHLVVGGDHVAVTEVCQSRKCGTVYGPQVSAASNELNSALDKSAARTKLCDLIESYFQCMDVIKSHCRGDLEYHTLRSLIRRWIDYNHCPTSSSTPPPPPRNPESLIRSFSPPSSSRNKNYGPLDQATTNPEPPPPPPPILYSQSSSGIRLDSLGSFGRIPSSSDELRKRDLCKESAFNYTIRSKSGRRTSSSSDSISIKSSRRLKRSSSSSLDISAAETGDQVSSSESSSSILSSSSSVSVGTSSSSSFKGTPFLHGSSSGSHNSNNRSPPLVCAVYGDPHLRTFDQRQQTCRIRGAWPFIDHPLFAIQISNSPIAENRPQVTGLTKITVLIRRFSKCGLTRDLIYEVDASDFSSSSSKTEPSNPLPTTFTNGKSSSGDGLIEIVERNSAAKEVIILEMNHVGARVYIGRSPNSNYLSLVVKFATASTERQIVHLDAIAEHSLCKSACPPREIIDVREILAATGVNLTEATEINAEMTNQNLQNETSHIIQRPLASGLSASDSKLSTCEGTYGYYRLACLYDMKIKGVAGADNACLFAQSFDHIDAIRRSIYIPSPAYQISQSDDDEDSDDQDYHYYHSSSTSLLAAHSIPLPTQLILSTALGCLLFYSFVKIH